MSDTLLDAFPDPLIGQLVGARYRVVRELGSGGMAVVYEGEHEDLGRRVAIKVIRHELVAHAPDAVDRFLQEARTASRLQHPSVVDVFDLGRLEDGRPFMVMPLLKGMDLERMLRERGPRPAAEVARLLAGPASALDAMHAQGIVHRDIKLENLFLERHDDGHESVRLMDFGLAAMAGHGSRMTRDGMVLGTPHYIAPEVARGTKAKASADIYGLATLAYELIAGVLPFDDDEPVRLMATKLVQDAPPLSSHVRAPAALDAVFAEALARDPAQRPKTCGELIERLARAAKPIGTAEVEALFDDDRGDARAPSAGADVGSSDASENRVAEDRTEAHRADAREPGRSRAPLAALVLVPLLTIGGGVVWLTRSSEPEGDATVAASEVATSEAEENAAENAAEPASARAPQEEPNAETTEEPPTVEAGETVEAAGEVEAPSPAPPVEPQGRTKRVSNPRVAEGTASTPPAGAPAGSEASSEAATEAPGPRRPSAEELARAEALNREAQSLALRGLLPAAVERYREATFLAPRMPAPWRGLGIAHERMRQNAEAKRAFERYLRLAPNASDSAVIRARVEAL